MPKGLALKWLPIKDVLYLSVCTNALATTAMYDNTYLHGNVHFWVTVLLKCHFCIDLHKHSRNYFKNIVKLAIIVTVYLSRRIQNADIVISH